MNQADSIIDAAIAYIRMDMRPVLYKPKSKEPNQANWPESVLTLEDIRRVLDKEPETGIGLQTGTKIKNLGWLADVDIDDHSLLGIADEVLPETGMISSRDSAPQSHYWYILSDSNGGTLIKLVDPMKTPDDERGVIIELRGKSKHATLCPPSIHPSGETLRWERNGGPSVHKSGRITGAVHLLGAIGLIGRYYPDKGLRHEASLAWAGALLPVLKLDRTKKLLSLVFRVIGDEEADKRQRNIDSTQEKIEAGSPVWEWGKLVELGYDPKVLETVRKWLGIKAESKRGFKRTPRLPEKVAADYVYNRYKTVLRYSPESMKWFYWIGTHWQQCTDIEVQGRFISTSMEAWAKEIEAQPEEQRKPIESLIDHVQDLRGLQAVEGLLRTYADLHINRDQFDTSPYHLNVANGIVDLRTKELLPHNPLMYFSMVVPTPYEAEAEAPFFTETISRMFLEDSEIITYIQTALGYSISGLTDERSLFILHGPGRNGKSVILNAVSRVIGFGDNKLARRLDDKAIKHTRNENQKDSRLAGLVGSRFVTLTELPALSSVDEALLKMLTGREPIQVRLLRENPFTYVPVFKLWIGTNYVPVIENQDQAIWDRIVKIEVKYRFTGEVRGSEVDTKLDTEAAGILKWLVDGAHSYIVNGLRMPKTLIDERETYRQEMDTVGQWIEEECTLGNSLYESASTIYATFRSWYEERGLLKLPNRHRFNDDLKSKGFTLGYDAKGNKVWMGFKLRTSQSEKPINLEGISIDV